MDNRGFFGSISRDLFRTAVCILFFEPLVLVLHLTKLAEQLFFLFL
jgi:hypothetical protein